MYEISTWASLAQTAITVASYLWSRYKKYREKVHNTSGAPVGTDKVPNLTTGLTVNTCNEGGQMNGILNNSLGQQTIYITVGAININCNDCEDKNSPKE